jgi:G:T/U-mismatch repair DNA glycosylase
MKPDILIDLIRTDLKLVICGTAAGNASAERAAYYAGRGNRFWKIMYEIGITGEQPEKIGNTEVWALPSTSGAANGLWNSQIWHQIRDRLKQIS